MSARSAKLLLEIAGHAKLAVARERPSPFGGGSVWLPSGLLFELVAWEKGYREHLASVAARREGARRAACRKSEADAAMFDAQALARVAEMLREELLSGDAKDMAELALRALGFPFDGGEGET